MRLRLSPTSINQYLRCPRQWAYRWIEGLRVPPAGAMKLGRSFHHAVEANYRQKIESHKDLPQDEVVDRFADSFKREMESEEVTLDPWQTKDKLKDEGVWVTKTHHRVIAPQVQPVAVEHRIELPIGIDDDPMSCELVGVVDLVDDHNIIRDNKAVARIPNEIDVNRDIQLTSYSLLHRLATGKPESGLTLDVVVKGKGIAQVLKTRRTKEALALHVNLIGNVAKGVKAEAFPQNPTTWACSPRFCGYWDKCIGRGLKTFDMGAKKDGAR